jgi:hypothetical protein
MQAGRGAHCGGIDTDSSRCPRGHHRDTSRGITVLYILPPPACVVRIMWVKSLQKSKIRPVGIILGILTS